MWTKKAMFMLYCSSLSNILNHTQTFCSLEELLSFQPTGIDLLIGEMKFFDFGTVEAYQVLNRSLMFKGQ